MQSVAILACLLAASVFAQTDVPSTYQPVSVPTSPSTPSTNQDRECGCTLANLWLDVVVVIDNSAGMGADGLTQVAADVATLFGQSRVGSNYNDPRSTRVGVVTYASNATKRAGLDYFTSTDEFIEDIFAITAQPSTDQDSVIKSGLSAAYDVLTEGRANGVRNNYKQVIIVYASDYKGDGQFDPIPISVQIKASGTVIITVAFDQGGQHSLLNALKNIATVNNAFESTDLNIVGEIQGALCQANCFCPNFWTQYSAAYGNSNAYKYGVCLRIGDLDAMWTASKFSCQNLYKDAYLASEFDAQKHEFNRQFFIADNTTSAPYMFHIGLSYDTATNQYLWEQPAGSNRRTISGQSYQGWNAGYPQRTSTTGCVLNQQAGTAPQLGWQNENCYSVAKRYLCQADSCDTEKYCP